MIIKIQIHVKVKVMRKAMLRSGILSPRTNPYLGMLYPDIFQAQGFLDPVFTNVKKYFILEILNYSGLYFRESGKISF